MSERLRRVPPAALLGGMVVVLGLLLYTQAVRVGGWSPDEEYFVDLSRVLIEELPRSLWDVPQIVDYNDRGIQRLLPIVLGVPLEVIGGEAGMRLAHLLLCLAFASAAIPAYLVARGMRLTVGWALAAGLLVVLTPWAVLSTGFLTESLAYPLALWAFWAAWRACVVPGLRSDLLAVALVVAAGLARTSLLTLVVVAPAAVTLHALLAGRVRRLPREHPLLTVFAVGGALLVLVSLAGGDALGILGGSYNTSLTTVEWGPLPEKFAGQLARIVSGTGFVLAVLALPWVIAQLVRRTRADPPAAALAAVAVVAIPALVLSTIYAAPEERYLIYAAPLVVVAGIAALARRDVPAWSVVVSGVVVAVLVDRVPWPYAGDAALLQTDAARSFLSRVVLTRVSIHVVAVLVLLAALALAVIVARRTGARRAALGAGVVLGTLLVLQLVQAGYVVTQRADSTRGTADLAARTWVDRAADGRDVAAFNDGIANTTEFEATWREVAFNNRSLGVHVGIDDGPGALIARHTRFAEVGIDERTGVLRPENERPLPRLWLVPTTFHPTGLAGERVATSSYLPVELVRVGETPTALYRWSEDVELDGWIESDDEERAVSLALFSAAREPGSCLRLTLAAPPGFDGEHRFTLSGDGVDRSGAVTAGARETIEVPIGPRLDELELAVRGAVETSDDRRLALRIAGTAVASCG